MLDKCKVPLCVYLNRCWNGAKCIFLYHNEDFIGLARSDYIMVLKKGWNEGEIKLKREVEKELLNWRAPTDAIIEMNARFINRLQEDFTEE